MTWKYILIFIDRRWSSSVEHHHPRPSMLESSESDSQHMVKSLDVLHAQDVGELPKRLQHDLERANRRSIIDVDREKDSVSAEDRARGNRGHTLPSLLLHPPEHILIPVVTRMWKSAEDLQAA